MATKRNVQIELEKLNKRFQKMRRNALNNFPLTGNIAIIMHKDTMTHFRDEMGDKGKWPELSTITIKRRRIGPNKGFGNKRLQDTGILRASMMITNKKDLAKVFSTVPYARIHQKGGRAGRGLKVRIPQRKYLWLSKAASNLITKSVGKFYIGEN